MKKTSLFLSIVAFSTGCLFILLSVWTGLSIQGYKSPLSSYKNDTMEHGSPITEKVVFVVVDGLRYDISCKMSFLNTLRENGSDLVSWTNIPSLSYPGWSALLTGARPEVTGKILNWGDVALRTENLFSVTYEMGVGNSLIGCPDWWLLLGDNITGGEKIEGTGDFVAADLEVKNAALRILRNPPSLTLIHFLSVDVAGHLYGGASEGYLSRAREIDSYIKEIAGMLDWNTTTLIVTSDHGHRDVGGHGGEEASSRKSFAVFYGKGIRKVRGEIDQIDICPTISNLLGLKIPSSAQGRILFECLDQSQENRAVYAYLLLKQRYFFSKAYLNSTGAEIQLNSSYMENAYAEILVGNFTNAEALSNKGVEEYNSMIEMSRESRIIDQQMNVGLFSFLGLLLSVWFVFMMFRREHLNIRELLVPTLLAGAILSVYFSIFFMIGMDFSFSVFNETSDVLKAILISFFVPGLLLFVSVTLYGYFTRRQQGHLGVKTLGVGMYGLILVFFTLFISVNGIAYGFVFTDFVTHIDEFMRVFLGGFICAGLLMYLGAALPLVEWINNRFVREP
ncbi:MAG: alkaline phosphatase family protein [Thermoplasmata archaeon]